MAVGVFAWRFLFGLSTTSGVGDVSQITAANPDGVALTLIGDLA